MHGALYVVADLEAYQENPEQYLAKNPLTVKDDLLKFNRPRTEWKLEELTEAVKEMETKGGRNFANGRQMFTVATCVACHKFGGQGNEFGRGVWVQVPTSTNAAPTMARVLPRASRASRRRKPHLRAGRASPRAPRSRRVRNPLAWAGEPILPPPS